MSHSSTVCFCSICGQAILQNQPKADHKVFDYDGTLEYIDLAHLNCAKQDIAVSMSYWQWDGKQVPCMA